jgi:hypothetical protein
MDNLNEMFNYYYSLAEQENILGIAVKEFLLLRCIHLLKPLTASTPLPRPRAVFNKDLWVNIPFPFIFNIPLIPKKKVIFFFYWFPI